MFDKQNVVCRLFEWAAGKVPRPGSADHNADKNGDGKLLPAEDVGNPPSARTGRGELYAA